MRLNNLSGKFRTIYIGGGTPTVLGLKELEGLLKGVRGKADGPAEFTIEVNPESIDEKKLALFKDNGVNRVSIGAQSFNDAKLKRLGRIHDGVCAKKAVILAHKKGFRNISIDLIFGVCRETPAAWKKDLQEASDLPVKHISCYSMDHKRLEAKEEEAAAMYEYAINRLHKKDFKQYEISNFAKDDYSCRHNLNYWNNDTYIGLGASAVSYIDGTREENITDVASYIKKARTGESVVRSSEKLEEIDRAKETAAVKIRTMEGIDFKWFKRKTGFDFHNLEKDALPKLLDDGLIEYIKDEHGLKGVVLSRKGILFCDIVSGAFL